MSYCFKETIGFWQKGDCKVSSVASHQTWWHNKIISIKVYQLRMIFHALKITNWTGSAATLNMCAQWEVVFKDTSWTEILHVKARSHSTFFHRRAVSSNLMVKKSSMKINVSSYIKKLFWQWSWGKGYKEKTKEISKTKKTVTVFSACRFDVE